ncbi:MAG: hypothetical protein E7594_05145 [Ruminococcaceae bacterium]|nr:hypothetical protein [Oscillospiraceae bacterium]
MKRTVIVLSVILALSIFISVLCGTVFAVESDSFVLEGATVEMDGIQDQTVEIVFYGTVPNIYYSLDGAFSLEAGNEGIRLIDLCFSDALESMGETDSETGGFHYSDYEVMNEVDANAPILTATYLIPADTKPDDYSVVLSMYDVMMETNDYEYDSEYTATITVTRPASSDSAYTAALRSDLASAKVGDTVSVDVLVGGSEPSFASSQLSLAFEGLTFVKGSAAVEDGYVSFDHDNTNGTLEIIDYGKSCTMSAESAAKAYTLTFTVNALAENAASGAAVVRLESAAFSKAAAAAGQDLTAAALTDATAQITITPADLHVQLPEGFFSVSGDDTVAYGQSFTFAAENVHYTYDLSAEPYALIDHENNTWTIQNVTSDVEVIENTEGRVAKQYSIAFTDPSHLVGVETSPVSAPYGTDFTFTLKEDVDASTADGMHYEVVSILYDDGTVVPCTPNGKVYTIKGQHITGNITVMTRKTAVSADQYAVEMPLNCPELTIDHNVVGKDQNYTATLTLDADPNYTYTVKYKIGDGAEVVINKWSDDGKFAIIGINGKVTVSVEKVFDQNSVRVSVSEYLALDQGRSMYLVKVTGELDYTYDSLAMFYSEKYDAQVYLVITDANAPLTEAAARAEIGLAGSDTKEINYDGNVNGSSGLDANDAQLVWNMYNAAYADFDAAVTVEKFLRADMNGDGKVDMNDAAEIVALIKQKNA